MKRDKVRIPLLLIFLCHWFPAFQASTFISVSPNETKHVLCDLGCKCLGEGMEFVFLDCSSKFITNLPTSLQFEQPLTKISFYKNQLDTLRKDTFSKVDSIKVLDLSYNYISKVENFTFASFKSLNSLRMNHNRLREIPAGFLGGLSNLTILNIQSNTIQRISPDAFRSTPHLKTLWLRNNPIQNLEENLLQYLPHLEKLDLQETGLASLPPEIFKPTPRLQELYLNNNAFEYVPEESLSHATMLKILYLNGNDFTVLEQGDFRRLSTIFILYLNNLSKLQKIEKDALSGLHGLKTFFCSFNPKLEYIDQDAFGSKNSSISKFRTPPSEQLILRKNALRTLKSPLEPAEWSSLSFVELSDNPWKCDCNLLWMKYLSEKWQKNIVCESPPNLRGRPLDGIDASEMICRFEWTLAKLILLISCLVVFAVIVLAASVSVYSRRPAYLYNRSKKQFPYSNVVFQKLKL